MNTHHNDGGHNCKVKTDLKTVPFFRYNGFLDKNGKSICVCKHITVADCCDNGVSKGRRYEREKKGSHTQKARLCI